MFDEVTKQEGGKNAAKRAGYVFGSTLFQVLLVFAIITASAAIKAKVIDEPVVDVKFVKAAAPPPPRGRRARRHVRRWRQSTRGCLPAESPS